MSVVVLCGVLACVCSVCDLMCGVVWFAMLWRCCGLCVCLSMCLCDVSVNYCVLLYGFRFVFDRVLCGICCVMLYVFLVCGVVLRIACVLSLLFKCMCCVWYNVMLYAMCCVCVCV